MKVFRRYIVFAVCVFYAGLAVGVAGTIVAVLIKGGIWTGK